MNFIQIKIVNLCRVCMKSETGRNMLNEEDKLLQKFEFVTHLQVRNDDLPVIICEKCILLLNISHNFIKTSQETEKNLRKFLTKIKNDFKLVADNSEGSKFITSNNDIDEMLVLLNSEDEKNVKKYFVETESRTVNKNKSLIKLETESEYPDDPENDTETTKIILTEVDNSSDDETLDEAQFKEKTKHDSVSNDTATDYVSEIEYAEDDDNTKDKIFYEDSESLMQIDPPKSENLLIETVHVNFQNDNDSSSEEEMLIPIEMENVESIESSDKSHNLQKSNEIKKNNIQENSRFCCTKCNRDFSTKTNLTRHLQLHDGKRPFECKICHKNFSQNGTLKQHMFVHTGEKPHICQVCNRGFTQAKSLVFHMRRHTGEKPHQCDYCAIKFRQKDALKVHILKHHTDVNDRAFSCKICNKEMSAQELHSHMKSHLNNHKTVESDSGGDIMQLIEETDLLGEGPLVNDELSLSLDGSTHVVDLMATSTIEPSRAKKYQCRKCFKCFAIKKSLIRHLSFH